MEGRKTFLRLIVFFSGPQIRITAEDYANAERIIVNTQVLNRYCLFRAETQRFFFSYDSLAYED